MKTLFWKRKYIHRFDSSFTDVQSEHPSVSLLIITPSGYARKTSITHHGLPCFCARTELCHNKSESLLYTIPSFEFSLPSLGSFIFLRSGKIYSHSYDNINNKYLQWNVSASNFSLQQNFVPTKPTNPTFTKKIKFSFISCNTELLFRNFFNQTVNYDFNGYVYDGFVKLGKIVSLMILIIRRGS